MKLHRPHIPLKVRCQVAARQLVAGGNLAAVLHICGCGRGYKDMLPALLAFLFGAERYHLDHDPPLMLRPYNPDTKTYTPDANDPLYLTYRTEEEHRIKTFIRGDGAQLSDAAKRRKEIRRRKKAGFATTRTLLAGIPPHDPTIRTRGGAPKRRKKGHGVLIKFDYTNAPKPIKVKGLSRIGVMGSGNWPDRPQWPKGRKLKSRGFKKARKRW